MRIVFLGTPAFAVPSLSILLEIGTTVVAVVTQPDRPAGRGRASTPPPVKLFALDHQLPVLQPERVGQPDSLALLADLRPDLLVTVAYGQLLPKSILALPRLAPLNVHASLLPHLRGAAPIHWAILRGDTLTGVSIMRMVQRLDAGEVVLQITEPIRPDDTSGALHDRLAHLGATALREAIRRFQAGTATFNPQDEAHATYAPQLDRSDARLDWNRSSTEIERMVRAMHPWPVAWSPYRHVTLKIQRVSPVSDDPSDLPPGTLISTSATLRVACGDGRQLQLDAVQLPGRPVISGHDFVNGHRPSPGDRLG